MMDLLSTAFEYVMQIVVLGAFILFVIWALMIALGVLKRVERNLKFLMGGGDLERRRWK